MARKEKSDFAIILTFEREGLGWKQTQLEEAAGLPPNMISDYENGHKQLNRQRLEYILSFMGVGPERIDALLGELEAARAGARSDPGDPFNSRRRRIEAIA